MRKTILIRLTMLLLVTTTLSGCIWLVEDGGYHHGGRGGEHGEHHEREGDRGGRR